MFKEYVVGQEQEVVREEGYGKEYHFRIGICPLVDHPSVHVCIGAVVSQHDEVRQEQAKLKQQAAEATVEMNDNFIKSAESVKKIGAGALTAAMRRAEQRVIAFALESADSLDDRARAKLERKGVDAIIANSLEAMDAEKSSVTWLTREGAEAVSGRRSKSGIATWIIERIDALLTHRP